MKNRFIIAAIIAAVMLAIAIIISSCAITQKRGCPSENYKNIQKHDNKKFTAYRVTYQKEGPLWVLRYENNLRIIPRVVTNCKPPFKSGTWQPL